MRFDLRIAAAAFAVLLSNCSGNEGDTVDPTTEVSSMTHAGAAPNTANDAKTISELFVQEDPTLSVAASATQNAQSIETQVTNAVQAACPGANIQLSGATVTANFGASCTVGTQVLSGTVSASVTAPAQQVQVLFTFTSFSLNGISLSGTLTALTSNGTSFTLNSNLTEGSDTLQLNAATITLDSGGGGFALNGAATLTTTSPATTQALTFSSVHHGSGACYPDSGSIQISKNATTRNKKSVLVTETVTFSSSTPTTGQVTLQLSGSPASMTTLPAHGSCH